MRFKKVKKLFENGNVCVCGLRGKGKDMLLANVIMRRKLPYLSNMDYGGKYMPLDLNTLDCGRNTYDNFINGKIRKYQFPYPDETDIYISDAGIYFPSQYCNELNKKYPHFATFQALTRQIGLSNFHVNTQCLRQSVGQNTRAVRHVHSLFELYSAFQGSFGISANTHI